MRETEGQGKGVRGLDAVGLPSAAPAARKLPIAPAAARKPPVATAPAAARKPPAAPGTACKPPAARKPPAASGTACKPSAATAPAPTCRAIALPCALEVRLYSGVMQPFASHSHSHGVIGLVREGRRQMQCAGREFWIKPGDVVAFNPGDVHGCRQCDGGTFAYDSIAFGVHWLQGCRLAGPLARGEEVRHQFELMLGAALDAQNSNLDATDEEALAMRLGLLFDAIGWETLESDAANCLDAAEALHACYRADVAHPPTLRAQAQREGVSTCRLIRAYQRRFAITPIQDLLSLRIDRAQGLLAQGMAPAAVAEAVGFADQPHLTREFKKRLGVTPGAYQRMVAAAADGAGRGKGVVGASLMGGRQ